MSCPEAADLGVIILAGGRSTRMGTDKAQVKVGGERLVDRCLRALPPVAAAVVVSPADLGGIGVDVVCEDPPYGGPVAGIAAGLAALDTRLIGVIAVDAPDSPALLTDLARAVDRPAEGVSGGADCAIAVNADGYDEPLCAVWRRDSLNAALTETGSRDVAARRLLRCCEHVVRIAGNGRERDCDTLEQLRDLRKRTLD